MQLFLCKNFYAIILHLYLCNTTGERSPVLPATAMRVILNLPKKHEYNHFNGLTYEALIVSPRVIHVFFGGILLKLTASQILICDFQLTVRGNENAIERHGKNKCLITEQQFLQNYHIRKKLNFEFSYTTEM